MKKNKEEEYIQKIIDNKIPKHLQVMYLQVIDAMKAGFYEGIRFERQNKKRKV